MSRLRAIASLGLLVGLTLFIGLIVYRGIGEVAAALAAGGLGLFLVAAWHLVPLFADALGWRCLLPRAQRPTVATMATARWLGESINGLLPVMQIGGNIVKARYIARRGVDVDRAAASVVVDVTLLVSTQLLFTLVGLALLPLVVGGERILLQAGMGAALLALMIWGFYAVQRRGLFGLLARLARRLAGEARWATLDLDAGALDHAVSRLYRQRRAVLHAAGWHLVSWVLGAGEVWLALRVLGHPVGFESALLLESLGQAVRAAAFAVPGALGVQEGGYLLLGSLLGIAPETALALSLAKRFRELVLGLPGLLVWQFAPAPR